MAGVIIVFLAVTGMPWSAFWGDQYMAFVRDHGLGRPAAPRPPAPSSTPSRMTGQPVWA
jgi:uncharacterized iron-regulated membrane protein